MTTTATILRSLAQALNVPVLAEEPKNPSASYVLVERSGGSGTFVREGVYTFQAYASSLQKAEELAETLRSAVLDLVQLPEIAGVHVNAGPYNYTDTRTHRYRYQLVAQIYHY